MNFEAQKSQKPGLKVLAIIEAAAVTGPAKNLLAVCQTARQHGYSDLPIVNISIATFIRNAGAQPTNPFVSKARELGIDVNVVTERFRFDTRLIAEMRRLASQQEPDIIQTHQVKSHFLMRASGLWRKHRWVAFHHGYTTTDAKMRAYNQLDRWSLRVAYRVVTMNEAFAQQLETVGVKRSKIRVLHNAVDVDDILRLRTEEVQAIRERCRITEDERVILAVGRLSKEKGHLDLVKAFTQLLRLDSSLRARLVIVGSGPEQEKLSQEISSSGLEEKVVFVGRVSDVKHYYAVADILALPSHSEGSPNVLLEAMAARLPVVATAVGGVPEIATDKETALLVKARDTRAMAQAMWNLLSDSKLAAQLAANAQAWVSRHHSPETRLRALLDLYKEAAPDRALSAS